MFKNLEAEMVRNGLSRKLLAKKIGMRADTLCRKMGGKTEFTLPELEKIINTINPDFKIEYLFKIFDDNSEILKINTYKE